MATASDDGATWVHKISAGLFGLGQERRRRYVAGFSLGYFVLVNLGAPLVHFLVVPELAYWLDPVTIAAHALAFVSLLCYVLVRRGESLWAGRTLVTAAFLMVWLAVLGSLGMPYDTWMAIFLCIAPLLAGFLWTPTAVVATGSINVIGAFALMFSGRLDPGFAAAAAILTSAVTLVVAVGATVRVSDEDIITRQAGQLVAHSRQLEAVLETTEDAICVVDDEYRVLLSNHAMRGLLHDIGGPVTDRLDKPLASQLRLRLARSAAGETTEAEVTIDERILSVAVRPLAGAGGHFVRIRDVTERHLAEQRRHEAFERQVELDKLREMNRFKSRLLNTASHELNTPLTPIRLQLELLKTPSRGSLSPEQVRSLDIIDRSTRRLGALVQDILDVARLESSKLQLRINTVSVDALVEDQIRLLAGLAEQGRVEVTADVRPAWIGADARRLGQVIGHLLENAIKFASPDGHVHVSVAGDQAGLRVEVRDDGRGVPASMREQLFQPFAQLHDQSKLGGTGLGLYISKGIVEAHGGAIGHEPLDDGSLFWFTLPGPVRLEEEE